MAQKFSLGDVVHLNSGSPNLTVVWIGDDKIEVQWYDGVRIQTAYLSPACFHLAEIDEEEEITDVQRLAIESATFAFISALGEGIDIDYLLEHLSSEAEEVFSDKPDQPELKSTDNSNVN